MRFIAALNLKKADIPAPPAEGYAALSKKMVDFDTHLFTEHKEKF